MAKIKPFRGLRPVPELASRVASLPYDVMDTAEARQMVQGNPCSFLHVTRSEVDLPETTDPYSPVVYQKARETLEKFIRDGIVVQDACPCFYVYRQKMGDHEQIGLVAGASVEEYQKGTIKKHELTRAEKEQDRVNHVNTTGAQTGPVFLTYRANGSIKALIDRAMEKKPVYDFCAEDGICHTLYVVDDPGLVRQIEEAFSKEINCMYIADGHHRSASAARVCDLHREQNSSHTGDESYNYFLSVIFPHDTLQIMDYNRVVKDLNGLGSDEFLRKIEDKFAVEKLPSQAGAFKPGRTHDFGMYLGGDWYRLTAREGTYNASDPVEALDVSVLQNNLLTPVLGIGNPRTDKRINFVGGIRGMKELERLVDAGHYAVAFSMFPTSIEELMAIADAGQIMPPKSTWFEPKLRDAMVVHMI